MDHLNIIFFIFLLTTLDRQGVSGQTTTEGEDLELEKQLVILNKQPTKSIQTKDGLYDCFEIYKQPTLDHPLLKDHKIQMKPTFSLKPVIDMSLSAKKGLHSVVIGIDCPRGFIPIQRTQKEDLIRANRSMKIYEKNMSLHSLNFPGQHIAAVRPKYENLTYFGVHAFFNAYALDVKDDQYSTAQMWIENGPSDQRTSLQAGWMVSPKVFGNKDTHLFIYWTTDSYKTGCYNNLCSGFVQVSAHIGPGSKIEPLSTYGGEQREIELTIRKDNVTGNWWLQLSETPVGYWPKVLVPQLNNGASLVIWGGLAVGPIVGDSPPMGNGHYPTRDPTKACFIRGIYTIDASGQNIVPDQNNLEIYVDNPACYGLQNLGNIKAWGDTFLFGGAGGMCGE